MDSPEFKAVHAIRREDARRSGHVEVWRWGADELWTYPDGVTEVEIGVFRGDKK